LEVLDKVRGEIIFDRGFDFVFQRKFKNEKEVTLKFRWYMRKNKIELWDILEDSESKYEEYKNGRYENASFVKRQLDNLNRSYMEKIKRAGLTAWTE